MQPSEHVRSQILQCLGGAQISGKMGSTVLQPMLAEALSAAGYIVDVEDSREVLRSKISVWRSKDTGEVVPTAARRRVDLVIYAGTELAALIEVESDLNDLRLTGVTKRNGHYDVASISKDRDGEYFDSYNSLERMATAAFCWHHFTASGRYPSPQEVVAKLEAISSDDPMIHNPGRLPLFLVSGTCRQIDHRILHRRLESLSATLICAAGA